MGAAASGSTSVKAGGAAAGEPSVLLVTHVQEESPASRVLRGGDKGVGIVGGEAVRWVSKVWRWR